MEKIPRFFHGTAPPVAGGGSTGGGTPPRFKCTAVHGTPPRDFHVKMPRLEYTQFYSSRCCIFRQKSKNRQKMAGSCQTVAWLIEGAMCSIRSLRVI